jgi:hypothetical protein
VPPVGFIGLQSVVCRPVRGLLVHRGAATRKRFRPRRRLPDRPSPDPFGSGSFSRALRPLRSSFSGAPGPSLTARHSRAEPLQATAPAWDFVPHRDITDGVHDPLARNPLARNRGDSTPRCVPSTGFLNLSTAFSATGFAGLFRPAATSRVRLRPGVCPRFAAGHGSSPLPASVPFRRARSPASRLPQTRPSTPRRCSANRCVPTNKAVRPCPRPLPSSGSLLSQVPARPP